MIFGIMACADLPKTNDGRYIGEPGLPEEYESLDENTRKETEFKVDSITKRYNTKFAQDCTPYVDGHKRSKRIDCVTFK